MTTSAPRVPRPAVGWLLGPELIAKLRKIGRSRRDPRDWMAYFLGFVHDECRFRDGRLIQIVGSDPSGVRTILEPRQGGLEADFTRAGGPAPGEVAAPVARAPDEVDEIWFDYISDLGDSSDAMYAVAYACQVDLELEAAAQGPLPRARPVHNPTVKVWRKADRDRSRRAGNLPRGQFLFVGGDTAYHVADEVTIRARVKEPFEWARSDLGEDRVIYPATPRLYGIPGNHDWYDDLDGFSLIFRRGDHPRAIILPGFERVQLGSYVAIQLPHDWQLWGLDIDPGMDERQGRYFAALGYPARLVLCTPSPPVVFGAAVPHPEHQRALHELGLPEAYLDGAAHELQPGHCRLDLSGDVHHYARYRSPHEDPRAAEPLSSPYASVVAGLGGAFHHPSFTRLGDRAPVVQYPRVEESLAAVTPALLHPRSVVVGSWIRAFPVLFAWLLGLGSLASGGAGWLLGRLLSWVPGLADQAGIGDRAELPRALLLLAVLVVSGALVAAALRLFRITSEAHAAQPQRKRNLAEAPWGFGPGAKLDPLRSYWPSTLLILAALALLVLFPRCPLAPRALTGWLDVAILLLLLLALIGGPVAAAVVGGKHQRGARKLGLAILGLVHGVAQLATPLLCARLVTASIGTAATAGLVVLATYGLLVATRPAFRRRRRWAVAALGIAAWLGGMAALIAASRGHLVMPSSFASALGQVSVGALVAIPLGAMYFAWYLAIAGLVDAHNNEVGGAARVTRFRQIIRFHLDRDGLTGYVISVEGDAARLSFALRDVFTVAPAAPVAASPRPGGLE